MFYKVIKLMHSKAKIQPTVSFDSRGHVLACFPDRKEFKVMHTSQVSTRTQK